MGYIGCSGGTPYKVLPVLRRAVSRYFLQHNFASKNAVLHGESHSAVRQHLLSISSGLLFAGRFRREDCALHQYPAIPDHVLLTDIRDYTIHIAGITITRQIPTLHDDPSRIFGRDNDHYSKRALSQTEHPQDGTLGETGLH